MIPEDEKEQIKQVKKACVIMVICNLLPILYVVLTIGFHLSLLFLGLGLVFSVWGWFAYDALLDEDK